MLTEPPTEIVEASWPIVAGVVQGSDGYPIFAALVSAGVLAHAQPWTQLVINRPDRLALRLPQGWCLEVLRHVPECLRIGDRPIRLGRGAVGPILPAPQLAAWLVTIKGKLDVKSLHAACRAQLDLLGVRCGIQVGGRRVIRVTGQTIVGYGVRLMRLSDVDSVLTQSRGLGGRNRFGCGVFVASGGVVG